MTRFVGIDPSTKTGFVALDEVGNVLRAKELTGVGQKDPKRMVTLIDDIMDHIQKDDQVAIEGFAFGAKGQGIAFQYGLGHGIRMALHRRNITFIEVSPAAVKKYATGKGNTKKDEMVLPIFKKWGFESSSDNTRDAFVLAQIIKAVREMRFAKGASFFNLTKYQNEVVQSLINPPEKSKKKKVK